MLLKTITKNILHQCTESDYTALIYCNYIQTIQLHNKRLLFFVTIDQSLAVKTCVLRQITLPMKMDFVAKDIINRARPGPYHANYINIHADNLSSTHPLLELCSFVTEINCKIDLTVFKSSTYCLLYIIEQRFTTFFF